MGDELDVGDGARSTRDWRWDFLSSNAVQGPRTESAGAETVFTNSRACRDGQADAERG